ncbi:hypothetical protein [Bacillus paranthracis]|uniref:hypothetical protein n=1 Tax=Bacillus paranthracis TaxID=2026186 RepID=UPI0021D15E11|nr:hypothetical protein [Bacillus paranthracis]MCU5173762.1 hypothetical protein [Bacillus paranthracis]
MCEHELKVYKGGGYVFIGCAQCEYVDIEESKKLVREEANKTNEHNERKRKARIK